MAVRHRSPRRLGLLALLSLVSLSGLVLDLFLLGPLGQPQGSAERAPRTIPNADVDPFGVNIFLDREVEDWKLRRTIEMIDQAGIGWVKQQFSWAEIEQGAKGDFWDDRYEKSSWSKFDRIVDLADEYGLEVIARIDRPPAWARAAGSNDEAPPLDPHTYADFIRTFIEHYRGRIHYIQVWNEPNLHNEWQRDAPVAPDDYATLLRLAYQAAKETDPSVQILCAPLAVSAVDDPNRLFISELTFLEELYDAGAGPYFDIMSANAYGFDSPPDEPPDPSQYNFRRVELLRMVMEKHGDAGKAIWFNEYGWNAAPDSLPSGQFPWGHVTEQQQAQWTVEGVRYAREHWPWAGVFSIWYFRQGGEYAPDKAEYYFRMVNVDFTPMPVYLAVQQATAEMATARAGWYEETAAPTQLRGDWQPVFTTTASAGSYLVSSEPSSRIEIPFLGSDVVLRVRRGPTGGRLLVRVDGMPNAGNALPRDSQGRAFVELYSPIEEWVNLAVVQGVGLEFPAQAHGLELIVAEEKDPNSQGHACAVDQFHVSERRSYILFGVSAGLLLILAAAAMVGLVVEARRPPAPRTQERPLNPWTVRPEQLDANQGEPPSGPPQAGAPGAGSA